MDNILLITENDDVAEKILSKLVLLRENDSIFVCDYKSSLKILKNSCISVVILHQKPDNEETLKYIDTLRSQNYEIILLLDSSNQELTLKAYDLGVNDYFTVDAESYEMLIRTVNCFKLRTLKIKKSRDLILLNSVGAINNETGFYKYKFCKTIFEDFINEPNIQNGMFIVLTVDENCRTRFSANKLSKAIEKSVRGDDLVFVINGGKFYIILPNIESSGALAVINKIQDTLGEKILIHAGLTKITNKTFERIEKEAFAGLAEACQTNEKAVCLEEKVKGIDEWMDETKNFKLFQSSYNHKLENVITPVFFRLQKTYEEKIFGTKIEQYTDELQSVFRLKNKKCDSSLRIIYPGFTKLFINIVYEGLDTPENEDIEIELSDVNQKSISKIVEKYIKDFKKFIKS